MAVLVDSGFRGGTDIVKALVMGALAVAGVFSGTDGSNPVPSSGESVSLPELLSGVENPGFPRGCARWLGDRVGRDAQGFPFRANRRQYLCRAIFQYRSAADGVGENATPIPIKSGRSPKLDRAVDRCARTGLNQSPARSADRARQAAGVSARGASLASDRAAAAHRGSPG